ncbi:ImmA/IrrE family metallo-endopeptidase [Rheinheimera oceanensis]|uniref:ImmA/IrrE family metallo-endopeptidase n=1 Tax=Rheinheimera oceanensis TaxID=2817449 RepID=UPI001BFE34DD|nr:ImmA/IrrE family metallo-endopeptidase [Rheinheimera oceanensis]
MINQDIKFAQARLSQLISKGSLSVEEKAELYILIAEIREYDEQYVSSVEVDPISAIKVRMSQYGLKNKDLEPFIGTKGNVSEVLNRIKPLSLPMIRRLSDGLKIPLEVLAKEYDLKSSDSFEFTTSLLKAVYERGYVSGFKGAFSEFAKKAEDLLVDHIESVLGKAQTKAMLRTSLHYQNEHKRSNKKMDQSALALWQCRVIQLANDLELSGSFKSGLLDSDILKNIAQLSRFSNGPLLAREELARYGIKLVVCQHLPKTYLDGAVIPSPNSGPIVALTLRYDRVDNFWFVLLHELSHIVLHYKDGTEVFVDDLDVEGSSAIEDEADRLASDSIISEKDWKKYKPFLDSPESVVSVAKTFNVSPALLAGRYRKEERDYMKFNRLVGNKLVREQFAEFEST